MTPTFREFLLEAALDWKKLNIRSQAMETLIKKLQSGEPFVKKGETSPSLYITPDPKWLKDLVKTKQLKSGLIPQSDGSVIKLSDLQKTVDLGSSGKTGTEKESIQLSSLDGVIKSVNGGNPIHIIVNGRVYPNCIGTKNTSGTPKSDFEILDAKGNSVIFISHKDGQSASSFSQWSGVSKLAADKEVIKFVADVQKKTRGVMPPGTTYFRKIKSKVLKNKACFGVDFGSNTFGVNNVTCILQGTVGLKPTNKKNTYELTAHAMWVNGQTPTGDYEPSLMAIYKGDRSDFKVTGARFNIYPLEGRKNKIEI